MKFIVPAFNRSLSIAFGLWVLYDIYALRSRSHPIIWLLGYIINGVFWLGLFAYSVAGFRHYAHKVRRDTHDLEIQIDKLGGKYLCKHLKAGLVIGIHQRGRRYIKGFGCTDQGSKSTPDGLTVYEIGSVTKVFTAIALGKLAAVGAISLSGSLGQFLPKGARCPQRDGCEPTLEQIATHTSGLPRLPHDLLARVKDSKNPYANYTSDQMIKSLGTTSLQSKPGKVVNYSNFGFGILGNVLESQSDMSYESFIQQSICQPLGLVNTTTRPTPDQKVLLTPGHDHLGRIVPNWEMDGMVACGGLYSNAEDLLAFLEAQIKEIGHPIAKSIQEAKQIHFRQGLRGIGHCLGLGWHIEENFSGKGLLHWHNGGTGGYASFVGFDEEQQLGVVILSNYGDAMAGDSSVDRMGMHLLKLASRISLNS